MYLGGSALCKITITNCNRNGKLYFYQMRIWEFKNINQDSLNNLKTNQSNVNLQYFDIDCNPSVRR